MMYPGEGKKGQPKAGDYVLAAESVRAEAAASPWPSTLNLARADRWRSAQCKWCEVTRCDLGRVG
jgi:hypothetical protein